MSAVDAWANKKTTAFCTSFALDAIKEASEQYQCIVTDVVTDNKKEMVTMKQNLKESNSDLTV